MPTSSVFRAGCLLALVATLLATARAADIVWTNAAGGSWAGATNWSPNQVPTASDTVYITNDVAFTVTVGAAASVSNLFLGPGPGTSVSNRFDQNATLTIHGIAWVQSNGWFRQSGQLNISNQFNNAGFFQWLDSPMRGNGRFVNATNGILHTRSAGVSTLGVRVLENHGYFLVANDDAGVQFASNATFTNRPSGDVNLALPCFGMQNASGATNTLIVNEGLIRATASVVSCPSYLTVDLINFGTLRQQTAGWYLGAGTNFGLIEATSAAHALSTVSADPFVLEAGTSFGAITPKLFAGGQLVVNTPLTIHTTALHVGDGSGGATTANPKLVVNADLVVTGAVDVTVGRIELLNPNANVFFKSLQIADSGVIGESRYITNAAALTVNSFLQNAATTDNAGSITVRSNLNFTTGNFRTAGGVIVLGPNSSSTFSGTGTKTLNGQIVTNYGTVTASATVTANNGMTWWNEPSSIYNCTGGTLDDSGTAGFFFNRGTVAHPNAGTSGGVDLVLTNAGGVISCVASTLTIGRAIQNSGRTELRGGALGGTLTLLGGTLDGSGNVGTVINGADVLPGDPLGTIRPTGSFTNLSAGTFHMQIAGITTNQYDRIAVAGTANLAGTLQVVLTNGFFPTLGTTFTAMTYTARSGVFDQILCSDYAFEVLYTATNLQLRASNALPAVTLTIGGGNTQLVCNAFSFQASANDPDGTLTNLSLLLDGSPILNQAGNAVASAVESDVPGVLSLVARATDDRGGVGVTTQQVSLVTLPPEVLMLGGFRSNRTFKICMSGLTTTNYQVLATEELGSTNWHNLGPMQLSNNLWRFFDPDASNHTHRFYRAERAP